jgi:drug/metabolite transporter (DMT)-like permease
MAPLGVKIGLREIPPFTLSFFRFLLASLVLLSILIGKKNKWFAKGDFKKVFIVSAFLCGNMLFFAYGIQYTTTIIGALIYTITPVLSAIGGYFLFKEKLSTGQILGVILAFLGVVLVIFSPAMVKGEVWQLGSLYGNFFVSLAAISFTSYSLGSKLLTGKYSPLSLAAASSLISLIGFLILGLAESILFSGILIPRQFSTFVAIVYLALGATVATLFLFQWTIKKTNAFIANLMFYIQPLTTGLVGYFFLQERITSLFVVGLILVLIGVFMVTNWTNK